MKVYIFLLCVLLFGCTVKQSTDTSVSVSKKVCVQMPKLTIKSKLLLNMLDSVICIQKKCADFSDSTFFVITYFKQAGVFCFEPYNNYKDVFNYNPCVGFLNFENHYFFPLFKYHEWFQETKEYSSFYYQFENMPPPPGEKGRIIATVKHDKIFYRTSLFCQ
ncbi:hypothetical protein [Paludibacter jiangxiensis]|uniref:Lipoprotein n=1 Tax=Paludibacter jiangxiensis TaxID=681398 RepID=A0A161LGX3_9BACT|nr:hypothetical protein [Paludibacter jiangxiensis]GAT64297.1 hypothetical protein PJIAN_4847 [Paludibacter jiangxiensis]